MSRTILVLAAHPDDEVLGCGASMARWVAEGCRVHVRILGEGVTSRYADPGDAPREDLAALHEHAVQAGAILGVTDVRVHGLPDNRFDSVPLLNVVHVIEKWVEELSPDVVYTQHGGDLNVDHAVTFRATLTATRPVEGCPVREVYAYEVASSTEWAFGRFEPRFTPDTFVDVTDTLDRKIRAMEIYESEARPFPHPRSARALEAAALRWGSVVGCGAAEPFETIRRRG